MTSSQRIMIVALPILWVAALGSAAAAVYFKHRSREMFVQLERLETRRDNVQIEWGQLQLEQSAWSTHAFVERVARGAGLIPTHLNAEFLVVRR